VRNQKLGSGWKMDGTSWMSRPADTPDTSSEVMPSMSRAISADLFQQFNPLLHHCNHMLHHFHPSPHTTKWPFHRITHPSVSMPSALTLIISLLLR
jgi:hypothetical protein